MITLKRVVKKFCIVDVLAEDDDEVLMNPNLVENEMHKKNVELRKRKDRYNAYEENLDEFGNVRYF